MSFPLQQLNNDWNGLIYDFQFSFFFFLLVFIFLHLNARIRLECFFAFSFSIYFFYPFSSAKLSTGQSVFANLFCQLTGLIGWVQNLIIEDWKVKCKTQSNGMRWLHFAFANFKGILVCGLRIVDNRYFRFDLFCWLGGSIWKGIVNFIWN